MISSLRFALGFGEGKLLPTHASPDALLCFITPELVQQVGNLCLLLANFLPSSLLRYRSSSIRGLRLLSFGLLTTEGCSSSFYPSSTNSFTMTLSFGHGLCSRVARGGGRGKVREGERKSARGRTCGRRNRGLSREAERVQWNVVYILFFLVPCTQPALGSLFPSSPARLDALSLSPSLWLFLLSPITRLGHISLA